MVDAHSEKQLVRKIRKLSVEGLPLTPFVHTLLEIVSPCFPLTMMPLILNIENPVRGIFPHVNMGRWGSYLKHYRSLPPEETGIVTYADFFARWKTVVPQECYFRPDFFEARAYNEFYRFIDVHHCAGILLRGHGTGPVHLFSFARGKDMRPFTPEDHKWLHRIAPYLDHAVSVAETLGVPSEEHSHDAGIDRDSSFPPGMVLLTRKGKILGMDDRALELLSRWTSLGGNPSPLRDEALRKAFTAMARTLMALGDPATDPQADVPSPALRLLAHSTGLQISLRGFRFLPFDEGGMLGVHVVESIPLAWRKVRIRAKYGLSGREGDVLERLAQNKPFKEIAADLGISTGALSTYVNRIQEKTEGLKLEDLKRETRNILWGERIPSG